MTAPLDAAAATALGLRALEQRREHEAVPVLAAAAARAPADAALHHVLGLLYRALGELAPAIAAFDQALRFNPSGARLVHARARAAMEAGLPSLDWFAAARRLAPNDGDVILGQAAALAAEGDGPAADRLLATMLGEHPGWLPGHAVLIQLRHAGGEAATAFEALDRAIATAPQDLRLHDLKIRLLSRSGAGGMARAAVARAQALIGEAALLGHSAVVATEHGDLAAADDAFARLDPAGDPWLALHWLRHLLRRHRAEAAAAFALALPAALAEAARPYLSLAWRLLDDPRAATLDDTDFIAVIDLGTDLPLDVLADTLRALHLSRCQPLDQSVRGGTQTDGPLFARLDPAIRQLRDRLAAAVKSYTAALPTAKIHPFLDKIPTHPRFAGSWSVRLQDGGYHEPHVHTEGWLSSAFYVALPANLEGDTGSLTLGEPQASLGVALPPIRTIRPSPGRLVLFPSTCWHGTRPFPSGERLTVAFDIT